LSLLAADRVFWFLFSSISRMRIKRTHKILIIMFIMCCELGEMSPGVWVAWVKGDG